MGRGSKKSENLRMSLTDAPQGVVLLFESGSGQLISVSDAHEITALRTAAASAVATKYLVQAKKEVRKGL